MIKENFARVDNTPAIGSLMVAKTETGHYRITINNITLELDLFDFTNLVSKMETLTSGNFPVCSSCHQEFTP